MVKGTAPRGRWPRQAREWGDWGSDPALPPRRHVGARPATLLQGWTPATCTLRRGRQGGGHLSAPPFESRGPRGSVSGLQMARGAQGDAGAGLGRQVQPEGARSPLTASWPTGPNESACSPEGPQLRFWKLPAPWPLTPMEPWSGVSGSSQTIGAPEPQRHHLLRCGIRRKFLQPGHPSQIHRSYHDLHLQQHQRCFRIQQWRGYH